MSEQQTERKQSILEDKKYSFSARPQNGRKMGPKGFFSVFKGNVSFVVYHNDDMEPKSTRVGMSGELWAAFVQMYKEVVNSREPTARQMKHFKGKPTEKVESGTLIVAKDTDGNVTLALQTPDRQDTIKFDVQMSNYATFVKANGEPYTRGEASTLFARGYIDVINQIVLKEITETWEPAPKQSGGGNWNKGGNNGGWNKGGNGGGGWNKGGGNGGWNKGGNSNWNKGGNGGYNKNNDSSSDSDGSFDDDYPM